MKISPYLHFNGNCKEAFDYYAKHLGAEFIMCMSYSGAPIEMSQPEGCPAPDPNKIMHARLELAGSYLMGSDAPEGRYRAPSGFSVSLDARDPEQAQKYYAALSDGGDVMMPLAETFWARSFAMLTDKFGVPWMINCEK